MRGSICCLVIAMASAVSAFPILTVDSSVISKIRNAAYLSVNGKYAPPSPTPLPEDYPGRPYPTTLPRRQRANRRQLSNGYSSTPVGQNMAGAIFGLSAIGDIDKSSQDSKKQDRRETDERNLPDNGSRPILIKTPENLEQVYGKQK